MNQAELESYCASALRAGQAALAEAMRTLVQREQPAIADALAHTRSDALLEPLLFAYFYAPEPPLSLPQLAFGHVAPALRPRRHGVTLLAMFRPDAIDQRLHMTVSGDEAAPVHGPLSARAPG